MKPFILPLFACSVLFAVSVRGEAWVTGSPDRADPVSYAVGDEVVWTFRAEKVPPSAMMRILIASMSGSCSRPHSSATDAFASMNS